MQAKEQSTYIDNLKIKLNLQEFQLASAKKAAASPAQPVAESPDRALQIPRLQAQISELMDELESVTLDKEQLMLENEELEEKFFECQVELEATKKAMRGPDLTNVDTSEAELSDADRVKALQIDNDKLREGLRRLNDIAVKDKEALRETSMLLEERERQCEELLEWRVDAEYSIADLQETVEASASFEAMIEKLTDQNLELSATMIDYKESIQQLEEAQELNDELEFQQKEEIEEARTSIAALENAISRYDKRITERDRTVEDQQKTLGKMRTYIKELTAKIEEDELASSFSSLEQKGLQTRLLESATLKTNESVLKKEVTTLYDQLVLSSELKYKYHSMFSRMDTLFGDYPVYANEARLLKTEVTFLSTMTTGFDAIRLLVVHWEQFNVEKTDRHVSERHAQTLSMLYMLLLQCQTFCVQSCLFVFKEPLTTILTFEEILNKVQATPTHVVEEGTVFMRRLKGCLEAVVTLSSKLNSVSKSKSIRDTNEERRMDFDIDDSEAMSLEESRRQSSIATIMTGFEEKIQQLMEIMSGDELNIDKSRILESGSMLTYTFNKFIVGKRRERDDKKYPTYPMAQMEMFYISINGLCDMGICKAEGEQPMRDPTLEEEPSPSRKDAAPVKPLKPAAPLPMSPKLRALARSKDAAEHEPDLSPAPPITSMDSITASNASSAPALLIQDYFKSIKLDVKRSLIQLARYSGNFVRHTEELQSAYQGLISCFAQDDTRLVCKTDHEAATALKSVLLAIRKIYNDVVPSNADISIHATITDRDVLRYFPVNSMTKMVTVGVVEEMALRTQFSNQIGRYWDLLIVGSSSLLNNDLSYAVADSSWKARVGEFKKTLAGGTSSIFSEAAAAIAAAGEGAGGVVKRATVIKPQSNRSSSDSDTAGKKAPSSPVPANATGVGSVSREQHNKVKAELELKREELRMVLRRIEEEAAAEETKREKAASSIVSRMKRDFFAKRAAKDAAKAQGLVVSDKVDIEREDLRAMQKEISMLEAALRATEEKLEASLKESKVMKQILAQPQVFPTLRHLDWHGSPMPSTPQPLTSSSWSSPYPTTPFSPSPDGFHPTIMASSGEGTSPAAIFHHMSITTHRHLLDQVTFWKKMSLVRLSSSLIPLPDPSTLRARSRPEIGVGSSSGRLPGISASASGCTDSSDSTDVSTILDEQTTAPSSSSNNSNSSDSNSKSSRSSNGGSAPVDEKMTWKGKIELLLSNGTPYRGANSSFTTNKALYRDMRRMRAENLLIANLADLRVAPGKDSKDGINEGTESVDGRYPPLGSIGLSGASLGDKYGMASKARPRHAFITFRIAH